MKNKSFFYNDLPVELIHLANRILSELNVDAGFFDHMTIIKWIKTFYEKGVINDDSILKFKQENEVTHYSDFYSFCENNQIDKVLKCCREIVERIRLIQLSEFFNIIIKKRNYNKHHFRNSKYILNIQTETLQLISKIKSDDFDLPKTVFKEISGYKWCCSKTLKPELDIDLFLYNESYELRRDYHFIKDDPIFENTGLEKIIYKIKIGDSFIYLSDPVPENEYDIVYDFLVYLMCNNVYEIDLNNLAKQNSNILLEINNVFNIPTPLKHQTHDTQFFLNTLKEYFKYSKMIEVTTSQVIFKFNDQVLINFFKYAHHAFDQRTLNLIINNDIAIYNSSFIWKTFVDIYMLAYEYSFDLTDDNLKLFKNRYISDYMLTEAMRNTEMNSNLNTLYNIIIENFNIKIHPVSYYYIDLFPYIVKTLNFNDYKFVLPSSPWKILDEFYKIFNKVYIDDGYGSDLYDSFNFISEDLTRKLIEIINIQYPSKQLIIDEMQNI